MTRALARLFRLPTVPHVGGLGSPTCSRQAGIAKLYLAGNARMGMGAPSCTWQVTPAWALPQKHGLTANPPFVTS